MCKMTTKLCIILSLYKTTSLPENSVFKNNGRYACKYSILSN